jgi:hypothetical protein
MLYVRALGLYSPLVSPDLLSRFPATLALTKARAG